MTEPMPDKLRALALAAQRRVQRLQAVGPVNLEPSQQDGYLRSPYAAEDWELWVCLLLDAFGTRSLNVANAFMRQLAELCPEVWDGENSRVDPFAFEQAVSIVKSVKPRNEAEAAQAAQMVAVHFATMKVGKQLDGLSYLDPRTASALAQLGKTYSRQLESISTARNGGKAKRQVIKVQKNVSVTHYHDERHVHLPGQGGGDSDGQAHGTRAQRAHATPTGEPIKVAALPSPDEGGAALSFSGCEGETGLPDSRRRERIGRTQGEAQR